MASGSDEKKYDIEGTHPIMASGSDDKKYDFKGTHATMASGSDEKKYDIEGTHPTLASGSDEKIYDIEADKIRILYDAVVGIEQPAELGIEQPELVVEQSELERIVAFVERQGQTSAASGDKASDQSCSGCPAACATLQKQYDKLIRLPVDTLLPALLTNEVVTYDQKKDIEEIQLKKKRMQFVLDLIIDSLKVDIGIKYNAFLKTLEESKDPVPRQLAKRLAPPVLVLAATELLPEATDVATSGQVTSETTDGQTKPPSVQRKRCSLM